MRMRQHDGGDISRFMTDPCQRRDHPIAISRVPRVDERHLVAICNQHPTDVSGPGVPDAGGDLDDLDVHSRSLRARL